MTYRRKTIRRLPTTTRKLAKMANNLEAEARRLRALIPVVRVMEDVYAFATKPKAEAQGELGLSQTCPTHGVEFDPNCTGCFDSFFGQGLLSLEAAVSRNAPEVQP